VTRRNPKKKRRTTAAGKIGGVMRTARASKKRLPKGGLNESVYRWLGRQPSGLYRVGGAGKYPALTRFKPGTSLQNAMTSTRIAASRAKESCWLVKVYPSGSPRAIVVRKVDKLGKTKYRVEE
jgi:hypothetical protein